MRDILFKAKRKDNGEWIYGYPMRHPQAAQVGPYEPYWNMFVPPADPEDTGGIFDIDPDTLCQYTGLKDKNGNEIWENDIVKYGSNILVRWSEKYAGWCLTQRGWMYEHFFGEAINPCDCEVVGNIADNPGMLIDKIRSDHG